MEVTYPIYVLERDDFSFSPDISSAPEIVSGSDP
jgi:hypothetical protein